MGKKGRRIDTQMHTSAAHAGASGRKSTVAAKIRHISGERRAEKEED